MMQRGYITAFLLFFISIFIFGQTIKNPKIHSHNDYLREKPFFEAYRSGSFSIEVDIVLKNDTLYVAHESESIVYNRTIETLYFDQIKKEFTESKNKRRDIQLLIDLKNEPYKTLVLLVESIKKYESILKRSDKKGLSIIISGKRPAIKDYINYPDYITFDYQSLEEIIEEPMSKVALISLNFRHYSEWNGIGAMSDGETNKVKEIILKAHSLGKPIRFWGTPDSEISWDLFYEFGVDFINTDKPAEAIQFFKDQ